VLRRDDLTQIRIDEVLAAIPSNRTAS